MILGSTHRTPKTTLPTLDESKWRGESLRVVACGIGLALSPALEPGSDPPPVARQTSHRCRKRFEIQDTRCHRGITATRFRFVPHQISACSRCNLICGGQTCQRPRAMHLCNLIPTPTPSPSPPPSPIQIDSLQDPLRGSSARTIVSEPSHLRNSDRKGVPRGSHQSKCQSRQILQRRYISKDMQVGEAAFDGKGSCEPVPASIAPNMVSESGTMADQRIC